MTSRTSGGPEQAAKGVLHVFEHKTWYIYNPCSTHPHHDTLTYQWHTIKHFIDSFFYYTPFYMAAISMKYCYTTGCKVATFGVQMLWLLMVRSKSCLLSFLTDDATGTYMFSSCCYHYTDVIMSVMAFQITNLSIVYSTVHSDAYQRKHQSSASLAFVRGIHRSPVNSPHKRPVTQKMFPIDHIIMLNGVARCHRGWTG